VLSYGDINLYSKVGYQQISEEIIKAPLTLSQPEGWLALSLTYDPIPTIQENARYIDALNSPKCW